MAASGGTAHVHATERWRHAHVFLGAEHLRNERRTRLVVALTAAMMVAEIAAGWLFGSMALVADGWHMATHAGALAISGLAYSYARRHAADARFAFGTGKLGDLAGFASALILAVIAVLIAVASAQRLMTPVVIHFSEAIPIAALGLAVNLASAWVLGTGEHGHGDHHRHPGHHDGHDHRPDHHDHHHDHHHGHDNNLRSAYVHVLADAATSVLAIAGLSCGLAFGWVWLDPVMGILGALVIANWSSTLIRDTGAVLLDVNPDPRLAEAIRGMLENGGDRVTDLHLWRIGPGHCGAIVSLVSGRPRPPAHYKGLLRQLRGLSHVTVEVHPCDEQCVAAGG